MGAVAKAEGERARLEDLVALCLRRCDRAARKLADAQVEHAAAADGLDRARSRLAEWHKANPDPQRSIFEEI